jgi:uncharacterized phage protein (TIGR01671 family)
MREIKFRAWKPNGILGHMSTVESIDWEHNMLFCGGVSNWQLSNVNLMQYTGLKDKNGTEIYQSDLVAFTEGGKRKQGEIVWKDREALFAVQMDDGWGSMALQNLDDIEILGNIYESPELLEQAT